MKKIVLATGITACVAVSLIAGANATERHHYYRHHVYHGAYYGPVPVAPVVREPVYRPEIMQIPERPVANDCIHVAFPQCNRGPN